MFPYYRFLHGLAASASPACMQRQLAVTHGEWIPEYSTLGTAEEWLPIFITNVGGTCSMGGIPRILPIGVTGTNLAHGSLTIRAAVSKSKTFKSFALNRGTAGRAYLKELPIGHWLSQ